MASSSQLTRLQQEVLSRFFKHETGFFLSGGAALAAYYLKHRATDDLDLFCLDALAFERGPFVLRQVADETRATLAVRQDAPGFKRFMLTTADEGVVVDLVLDRVFQLSETKRNIGSAPSVCAKPWGAPISPRRAPASRPSFWGSGVPE